MFRKGLCLLGGREARGGGKQGGGREVANTGQCSVSQEYESDGGARQAGLKARFKGRRWTSTGLKAVLFCKSRPQPVSTNFEVAGAIGVTVGMVWTIDGGWVGRQGHGEGGG